MFQWLGEVSTRVIAIAQAFFAQAFFAQAFFAQAFFAQAFFAQAIFEHGRLRSQRLDAAKRCCIRLGQTALVRCIPCDCFRGNATIVCTSQMSQAVPVLMYHHVSPNPGLVTVSPENFAAQMAYLARAGYSTITADQLSRFIHGHQTLPQKSVLITFDDGFLDNYVYAYPELQKHGFRASIFVVTAWIRDGTPRAHAGTINGAGLPETPNHKACKAAIREGRSDEVMMRWSEMQAAQDTLEVHSHTHSHVRWDQLFPAQAIRLKELENDLAISREVLQRHLGKTSAHLCWPWGYYEPAYQTLAQKLGFAMQYTVEKGVNVVGRNPLQIAREVVKDRGAGWLAKQLWIYRHGTIGHYYARLRGK
jgi:peptidoglycan/xylan/chitin deacetylase (PgdA/CDA1 family)